MDEYTMGKIAAHAYWQEMNNLMEGYEIMEKEAIGELGPKKSFVPSASQMKGVGVAYAYQAGREVRVLVKGEEVSDKELPLLARRISQELEQKVAYVGQIKVTCIRESRVTETTKAK